MNILVTLLTVLAAGRLARAKFTYENITVTPFDGGDSFLVDNKTNWGSAKYSGSLPSQWSSFQKVAYTNTPGAALAYYPDRIGIFALYIIGSYKADRQSFRVTIFQNQTVRDAVTVSAHAASDDSQLYALYSLTNLDPFTSYGLVISNSLATSTTPVGYLAISGILQSSLVSDGDSATNDQSVSYARDPSTLYVKPGATETGTNLAQSPNVGPTSSLLSVTTVSSTLMSSPTTVTTQPPSTTDTGTITSMRTATGTASGGTYYPISGARSTGSIPLYRMAFYTLVVVGLIALV